MPLLTDLSKFQFSHAFCDSKEALDQAYAAGLSQDTIILTRSPYLLETGASNILSLDHRAEKRHQAISDFYHSTSSFLHQCKLQLDQETAFKPFSTFVARHLWFWQQRALFAAFFDESDYAEPRLIIRGDFGDPGANFTYNLPWQICFGQEDEFFIFEPKIALDPSTKLKSETEPLLTRLMVRGGNHFLWRLFEKVWSRAPGWLGQSRFCYFRNSELVQEIGLAHILRGWRPIQIQLPSLAQLPASLHERASAISDNLESLNADRWATVAPQQTFAPIWHEFRRTLSDSLHHYDHYREWLDQNHSRLFGSKRNVIVTNYPVGPASLALSDHADKHHISYTGVQHGVARELVNSPQNACNYENSYANKIVVFNEQAKALTANSPFRKSETDIFVAGLPNDVGRLTKNWPLTSTKQEIPPILFVQMLNRSGSFFNGIVFKDDRECLQGEKDLVDKVFDLLPRKVGFKYYPHQSYADRDPVLDYVDASKNTELIESGEDLRYLIQHCEIVITVGISSTLSWCVFSGKPVIYIDPAIDGFRVSEKTKEALEKALFYFDSTSDGFHNQLAAMLSKPQHELEALWADKEADRNSFITRFFGTCDKAAGKKTMQWLNKQKASK